MILFLLNEILIVFRQALKAYLKTDLDYINFDILYSLAEFLDTP